MDIYIPAKTKSTQKEDFENVHGRDLFMTPNYATELLIPFLPKGITIWECASGKMKMANIFKSHGFKVVATDLSYKKPFNFLTDIPNFEFSLIGTNPPFSIKQRFYEMCLKYDKPFALLIPADYSIWSIEAVEKYGCEKIIPTRRIDYITPNILNRIWEGESFEAWKLFNQDYAKVSLAKMKKDYSKIWQHVVVPSFDNHYKFENIYDAPPKLLRKYSSSDFHSLWLTRGLKLGKTETFVELTNKMKDNI